MPPEKLVEKLSPFALALPMALHPNPATASRGPMAGNPNAVMRRTESPAARHPNPASLPRPIASDPDVFGTGRSGGHFHLRRWRRLGDYHLGGFGRHSFTNNHAALDTTGKQRDDGQSSKQKFIPFHIVHSNPIRDDVSRSC